MALNRLALKCSLSGLTAICSTNISRKVSPCTWKTGLPTSMSFLGTKSQIGLRHRFTSPYVIKPKSVKRLEYLPLKLCWPNTDEKKLVFDYYRDSDFQDLYTIMSQIIENGREYPQETMDEDEFKAYFLSDAAFSLRDISSNEVLGGFYVKPNFPGRSSHLSNAGFILKECHRGKGLGELLLKQYLRVARDLGYLGSFFNLVYACNQPSINLLEKYGFRRTAVIPDAGELKGLGYVDAYQYYYDLETLNEKGEPPGGWPKSTKKGTQAK